LDLVIAGGGVAALEAVLALRELAGERVRVTMLAPEREFVDRPTSVLEPFSLGSPQRLRLDEIAADLGFELRTERLKWVDPGQRIAHTETGEALAYDVLLLALGAVRHARFRQTLTLDADGLGEQLRGLVQDIEGGYLRKIAFLIPERPPWPLPIYELALLAVERADDMNIDLDATIVTPEMSPLAAFGGTASGAVAKRLIELRIKVLTGATCEVDEAGKVTVVGSRVPLEADRLVALPELSGPVVPGIPLGPRGGFFPIDEHCRVRGLERVFAAGDATDYPVKLGGIAAQQADVAAESIAALAGVELEPSTFRPVLEAILFGGGPPLPLSSPPASSRSECASAKVQARHLTPYLAARDDRALVG
jgi:sulfide:quinone oxidoreductase